MNYYSSMIGQSKYSNPLLYFFIFLLLLFLLSVGIYLSTSNITFGNDFYVFHSSSRTLFIDGVSPYSEQVEVANQYAIYGRLALPGENLMTFSYPPYALLPFLPLAFLPLKWAQSIWISFLFTSLLILPILVYPRIPRWALTTAFLLYPITFSLILGNFAILMGTLILFILGYLLNSQNHSLKTDIIAGALLAFCTIKPQFSVLFLLFILLFALRFKRWWLIKSFFINFLMLITFSFIVLPTWPIEWYHQLIRYSESNQAIPHIAIFLQLFTHQSTANTLAIILTILMFLVLIWMLRKWWRGHISSIKILAFIGFFTYFIHPRTVSYEQIVFLVPFLVWIFINPANIRTHTKLTFWFVAILVSWAGFFASKGSWESLFPLEWIFLLYLIWMVYLFSSSHSTHEDTKLFPVP